MPQTPHISKLLKDVRSCSLCASHLPLGPRPVLQISPQAKILIVGQAPGRKVHETGIPFDDASGNRLREWMRIGKDIFYDESKVAILPMGFCYPGTGKSGDLPPRKECAEAWRESLLSTLTKLRITLVIGQYALAYHLPKATGTLTEIVRSWKSYGPSVIPLPHPSPRNNIWLKRNEWFEEEVLPALRARVIQSL